MRFLKVILILFLVFSWANGSPYSYWADEGFSMREAMADNARYLFRDPSMSPAIHHSSRRSGLAGRMSSGRSYTCSTDKTIQVVFVFDQSESHRKYYDIFRDELDDIVDTLIGTYGPGKLYFGLASFGAWTHKAGSCYQANAPFTKPFLPTLDQSNIKAEPDAVPGKFAISPLSALAYAVADPSFGWSYEPDDDSDTIEKFVVLATNSKNAFAHEQDRMNRNGREWVGDGNDVCPGTKIPQYDVIRHLFLEEDINTIAIIPTETNQPDYTEHFISLGTSYCGGEVGLYGARYRKNMKDTILDCIASML